MRNMLFSPVVAACVEELESRLLMSGVSPNPLFSQLTSSTATQTDDVGNTLSTSAPVPSFTKSTSLSGKINYVGDVDVFRFVSPASGTATLSQMVFLGGIAQAATVYNANGAVVAATSTSALTKAKLTFNVVSGQTYYVSLSSASKVTGAYRVTLAVAAAAVTQPPTFTAVGSESVNEAQTLQFVVNATDPAGAPLTYTASNLPAGATFNAATQTFSWTPTYTQAGNYNVTFTASDGTLTGSTTAAITVANVDRSPVMTAVGSKSVNEAQPLQFVVSATDADGDPLTYTASNLPTGATFNTATQTFSWTPSYTQAGNYNVTFTASDGTLTGSTTAAITVANIERSPVMAAVQPVSSVVGQVVSFKVSATDPDGDVLAYTASNLPTGATFDPSTQLFTWNTASAQAGSYSVTFTASDGTLSASTTAGITLTGVDHAPVMAAVGNKSVNEGQPLQFVVSATDADGDPLTYTASNLPTGATFNAATQTFSWTPSYTQAGNYNVTFTASDGTQTGSTTAAITVANVDRSPVMTAVSNKSVTEGQALQFVVSATDADGDPLTYTASNLPTGATFNAATQTFSWTPTYTQAGNYNVTFTASDGTLTGSTTAAITVANVDHSPVMTAIGGKSVTEGQALQFVVSATDADGDPLTYTASNLPTGATFNAATQTFSWTPTYTQAGNYNVTFTASDGALTGSTTSAITVVKVNKAPVMNAVQPISSIAGQVVSFQVSATDANGDAVTYTASNLPTGATFNPSTQMFTWNTTSTQTGTFSPTFTASDGTLTGSTNVSITLLTAPSGGGSTTSMGIGKTNAYYIDKDGDGYGVASPLGPDADDSDPTVNTYAQALAKYGTVKGILSHLGYSVNNIYYIGTNGSDTTGQVNNINSPYATFATVHGLLKPGDALIYLQGTYTEYIDCEWPIVQGTASQPILIMAMPGQKVTIDNEYGGIVVGAGCHDLIFDGFTIDESNPNHDGRGVWGDDYYDVTFKNIESMHHSTGIESAQGLNNLTIEGCVIHDNPQTHGIYIGSRDEPNSNITITGNLIYNNGYNGIQHNGRVTNLVISDNIIHDNRLSGITFLDGVSNSTVSNNLIFNNDRSGITFYNYDEDPAANIGTLPYPMNNNLITNNTIWVGTTGPTGLSDPTQYSAIFFSDDTAAQAYSMSGNVIQNNILVTQQGEAVKFSDSRFATATTIKDNVIYRTAGNDDIISVGQDSANYVAYNWTNFAKYSPLISNNIFADPQFADVSTNYYNDPTKFDFDLLASSPAINFGVSTNAPTTDLRGKLRVGLPDAGAYEA